MNVTLILFCKGTGGNFFSRVLTLNEKTVPLGRNNLTTEQRALTYNYKNIDNKIKGQYNEILNNGLSKWVDIELNEMFFPLTRGVENLVKLNLKVIGPIHPEHFEAKKNYFGVDDQINVVYIDPTDCENWIVAQMIHKGVIQKTPPIKFLKTHIDDMFAIAKKINAVPVSLKNILESPEKFLIEYHIACGACDVTPYDFYAIEVYKSWKETWA